MDHAEVIGSGMVSMIPEAVRVFSDGIGRDHHERTHCIFGILGMLGIAKVQDIDPIFY
jgi:hypothetical protein